MLLHQMGKVNRDYVQPSVVFVVVLAVAALWSAEAEFARVVFKIEVMLDEVWVLLYKMMKFIWKKGEKTQQLLLQTLLN